MKADIGKRRNFQLAAKLEFSTRRETRNFQLAEKLGIFNSP
jgi:hypothetical protein